MKRRLILGPPGTGKTTRLLKEIAALLAGGAAPAEIAFVSFTRTAVGEGRSRAESQFGLTARDLPYFRTLHSLCFNALGLRRSDVMSREHYAALGAVMGEDLDGTPDDAPVSPDSSGALVYVDHYARNTGTALFDAYHEHGGELDWQRLSRFDAAHRVYKADHGLTDFTDMLSKFVEEARPAPVRYAFVDEAQDLTALQWSVVQRAFCEAELLVIAGDDDQAVHRWAGADPAPLITWPYESETLDQSYRLPRQVFVLAAEIAGRMEQRRPKHWRPRPAPGHVDFLHSPEEVDLSSGDWLMMARTRHQLKQLREIAHAQGVAYSTRGVSSVNPTTTRTIQAYEALRAGRTVTSDDGRLVLTGLDKPAHNLPSEAWLNAEDLGINPSQIWHDALIAISVDEREYCLSILRAGDQLTATPRIRIETIHGAKGSEAQNCLLLTDLTRRANRALELDPDSEHRVFYVGATRARENLFVVPPQGQYGYPI